MPGIMMDGVSRIRCVACVGWLCISASSAHGSDALVRLSGAELKGGAKDRFGAAFFGEQVNYVYAQTTGPHASVQGTFDIGTVPDEPLFLLVRGRDDEAAAPCRIEILLNGSSLFQGASGFANDRWCVRRFTLPPGVLRKSTNELVIRNLEPGGTLGMPPWFMVAWCVVEVYPGMLLYDKGTSFNPVREQFLRLSGPPHSRYVAQLYLRHLQGLSLRMVQAFPQQFSAERQTLNDDIAWMQGLFTDKYGEELPR
ncbi:MAG: hypothetical protein AB1486_29825 [Planctomycetota bacterium]